jgi:hypothetical protein
MMNAKHSTSKIATAVFWSVAILLVIGFAVVRAIPKRAAAASNECYVRIRALGALMKAYAGKHGGQRPTSIEDFRTIAPSMTPAAWFCPSDRRNSHFKLDWERFSPADASYRLVASSDASADGDIPMIRCLIHGHILYRSGKTE